MKTNYLKNNFLQFAVIAVLIIVGHYLSLLKPLENIIIVGTAPWRSLTFNVGKKINQEIYQNTNTIDWVAENQTLKNTVEQLTKQLAELKIFIEEQGMVDKQNAYLQQQKINFVSGRVIGQASDVNPFIFIINKGEKDGVKKDMAVVNDAGTLVGRIISVSNNQSFFQLLISNASQLSVAIAGQNEIIGLVTGAHNISLKLDFILKNAPLKPGDLVITSGHDLNVPAGLVIGRVGDIVDDKKEIFKNAQVISPADFKNITVIAVILGHQ